MHFTKLKYAIIYLIVICLDMYFTLLVSGYVQRESVGSTTGMLSLTVAFPPLTRTASPWIEGLQWQGNEG